MKTKEEAFEEYSSNIAPHLRYDAREDFSAGWDVATANHDQEMVEFAEWADLNWWIWNTYAEALTKFRESKQQ